MGSPHHHHHPLSADSFQNPAKKPESARTLMHATQQRATQRVARDGRTPHAPSSQSRLNWARSCLRIWRTDDAAVGVGAGSEPGNADSRCVAETTRCCPVNHVWRRPVRPAGLLTGRETCPSAGDWFGMKQDASVSESLLPSVPGSLLGRDPDHQRDQLGMLPFSFDHERCPTERGRTWCDIREEGKKTAVRYGWNILIDARWMVYFI